MCVHLLEQEKACISVWWGTERVHVRDRLTENESKRESEREKERVCV